MAQMKEQNKTPAKELNETDNQPIRGRVQNTGDQDAQKTHWVQQQHKKDLGRNEGYAKWIKKNPQETNSEGKEARILINDLEHKEEINMQLEQNEETRIQKNKTKQNESLRRL